MASKKLKEDLVSVSEFKAKALGIFDDISKTGRVVTVTKHGRPLAKVLPFPESKVERPVPGKLAGTILYEGDIVSPLGAGIWHAAKAKE